MNIAQQMWHQHQLLHASHIPAPHLHPAFMHVNHMDAALDQHYLLTRVPGKPSIGADDSPPSFTIDAILGRKSSNNSRAPKQVEHDIRQQFTRMSNDTKVYNCDNIRDMKEDCYEIKVESGMGEVTGEDGKRKLHPYCDHSHSASYMESVVLRSSGHSKNKRVRTIFTPEQLERLEEVFHKQQYMVGSERYYLAASLNLSEAQVKVWFQNRRIKWRKQQFETEHQRFVKTNIFQQNSNSTFPGICTEFVRSNDYCGVEYPDDANRTLMHCDDVTVKSESDVYRHENTEDGMENDCKVPQTNVEHQKEAESAVDSGTLETNNPRADNQQNSNVHLESTTNFGIKIRELPS